MRGGWRWVVTNKRTGGARNDGTRALETDDCETTQSTLRRAVCCTILYLSDGCEVPPLVVDSNRGGTG